MQITGKTAGYAIAGLGWAMLALGLGLDQAGLRAGPALATVGGWVIATGLALAVIAATERGFGALDRFFGEILARTRRPSARVEPTFDAVAEPAPALAPPAPAQRAETRVLAPQRAEARPAPPLPQPVAVRRPLAPAAPLAPPSSPALAPRGPAAAYGMDDETDDMDEAAYAAAPVRPLAARETPLRQAPPRQAPLRQAPPRLPPADFPQPTARQERAPPPRADAYPLDAPQPARRAAQEPRERPRAPGSAPAPVASSPPGFDELLDWAALEARVGGASDPASAPGEPAQEPANRQVEPARKASFHPAPSAPANLDAPRGDAARPQAVNPQAVSPQAASPQTASPQAASPQAAQPRREAAPRAQAPQRLQSGAVIEEGEIAGHAYRVMADLTVEIDTVLGARVFDSMEAARRFVGAPDRAARARSVA